MTPERWQHVERLYHAVLARSPEARAAFLAQACGSDQVLQQEIELLLAQRSTPGALDGAAVHVAARLVSQPEMSIAVGRRLGVYEIVAFIGAGGMGEVYRAHDTRLGRDVAVKVLPRAFTDDPDRLARFEREARVLASLNHPNLATIHAVEESEGTRAIVMELIPGETLREMLERLGAPRTGLDLATALGYARQIADGLDAAHEKGIVHRDLKPANVKVTPDGVVKVLDFGLARTSVVGEGGSVATRAGLIMGTAAYMSPEQARGLPVDKRADIWAFGCVLYEMLAGRNPFDGVTVSDVIANVLGRSPDPNRLPPGTPEPARRVLRRCLEKDLKLRLRDIADARSELDEAVAALSSGEEASTQRTVPASSLLRRTVFTTGAVILASSITWLVMRPAASVPRPVIRVASAVPPGFSFTPTERRDVAISRDGTRMAYRSRQGLVVQSLDGLGPLLIPLAATAAHPFFSPDGQWIGFSDPTGINIVSVSGGSPRLVAMSRAGVVGTWGPGGIVFADANGLFRVADEGGALENLAMAEPLAPGEQASFPEVLPDGITILFTVLPRRTTVIPSERAAQAAGARIDALDSRTGVRTTVLRGAGAGRYVPTGHLLYAARGRLNAIGFDLERVEVRGDPVELPADRSSYDFAVASDGTLVYGSGGGGEDIDKTLVWVNRDGSGEEPVVGARPGRYIYPRLSHDGTRIAVTLIGQSGSARDIFIWHLLQRSLDPFSVHPSDEVTTAWSPNDRQLAFGSDRAGDINKVFSQPSDGSGTPVPLLKSNGVQLPLEFTQDGRLLLAVQVKDQGWDVVALSLDGSEKTESILNGPRNQSAARLSLDGKWLAYDSDESGQDEVYVRPYPNVDSSVKKISSGGGRQPMWSRDGRELFYRDNTGAMMAVSARSTPSFEPGPATRLFDGAGFSGPGSAQTYDVAEDGRFLMLKKGEEVAPALFIVVNWFEELKQLVPYR